MELGQLAPTMSDFDSLQVFDGLLGEGHDAGAFDVDVDCFSDETVSATASDGDAGGASEHDEPKIAVPVVKPAVGGVHSRQRSECCCCRCRFVCLSRPASVALPFVVACPSYAYTLVLESNFQSLRSSFPLLGTSYDWMSSVSPLMGSSRLGGIGAGGFGVKSTTPLMEGLVLGPGAKPAPIKLGQGMWQQQHQQQQQQQVKRKSSGNRNKRSRAERDGIQGKANGHHGNNKATATTTTNNNNGDNKNGSSKANANANVNLGDGNPMIMGAIRSILSTGDPVAAQQEAERLGMSARKRRRVTVTVGARQQQRQQQQQQQHRAQYLHEDDGHDQGESSETSEDTDDDAVLSFSSSITANVPFFGMESHGNGSGSNSNTGRVTPTPEFRLSLGASPSMSPMRGDMLPHGHGGLPLKNLADFDAGAVAGRLA